MSKDSIYGWFIALLFLIILVFYTYIVPYPIIMAFLDATFVNPDPMLTQLFLMGPVYLGVLLFCFIFIWIGYTMATTPPPEPIDLDSLDLDDDEEKTED